MIVDGMRRFLGLVRKTHSSSVIKNIDVVYIKEVDPELKKAPYEIIISIFLVAP